MRAGKSKSGATSPGRSTGLICSDETPLTSHPESNYGLYQSAETCADHPNKECAAQAPAWAGILISQKRYITRATRRGPSTTHAPAPFQSLRTSTTSTPSEQTARDNAVSAC